MGCHCRPADSQSEVNKEAVKIFCETRREDIHQQKWSSVFAFTNVRCQSTWKINIRGEKKTSKFMAEEKYKSKKDSEIEKKGSRQFCTCSFERNKKGKWRWRFRFDRPFRNVCCLAAERENGTRTVDKDQVWCRNTRRRRRRKQKPKENSEESSASFQFVVFVVVARGVHRCWASTYRRRRVHIREKICFSHIPSGFCGSDEKRKSRDPTLPRQ